MIDESLLTPEERELNKLSTEELEQLHVTLLREQAAQDSRADLLKFAQFMRPDPQHYGDARYSRYQVNIHHKVIAEAVERVFAGEIMNLALSVPPQHGKLCAHDTPVLTADGWKVHGDLRVGDRVVGSSGDFIPVIALSEDGHADCEVKFTDGSVVRVHERHEWRVFDRSHHKYRVIETAEMMRDAWSNGRARYQVDWVVVRGAEADLPVEPYALGAWLGDGTAGKALISHALADSAVADEVGKFYPVRARWTHKTTGVIATSYHGQSRGGDGGEFAVALKRAGVYLEKHIPDAYFVASKEQRQRLLAGLMDTDGYVHHATRRATFSTCNTRLANDVAILIRSLGMRATIARFEPVVSSSGIVGRKPVYQVTFSPAVKIPCALERKATDGFKVINRRRGVREIRRCNPVVGRCIEVCADDGIYLVGHGLVPTHNSDLASRLGLAYHIGRWPWKHILMGTYNQTFSEEFGDDVRAIINQPEYAEVFPRLKLRTGAKAKDHMVTEDGGKVSFLGRGGSGTGRPADGMLVDDPIKDSKEAESLTVRDDTWKWFVRVMNTRCHKHSWKIVIQTRWSDDDVIGRLTDPTNPYYNEDIAKQWTYINIPALMDTEDIAKSLGKQVGDALWPERFPIKLLNNMKAMDPVGFSALYQGRPTPPEGAFYKQYQLRGYGSPNDIPKEVRYYLTGDLAVSPEIKADKSCVGIWALDREDNLWLLPDLYWDRKSSDESVEKIILFCKQYMIFEAFFEKGQLDRAIGPFLNKRMLESECYVPTTKMPVSGDKGHRSLSIRGRMAQGKVRFPTFAPWWTAAKDQLLKFTGSGNDKEDDFCDMIALIGQAMGKQIVASGPAPQQNVIKIGTFGWVKQQSKIEEKQRRRSAALSRY